MPNLVGKKLASFTTRYWFVAAVMLGMCCMGSYAAAADVDQLLQQASAQASQLSRDSATLDSFSRSNVSWQSHTAQVNTIRTHINQLGQTLSQLEAARDSAGKSQQGAIDRIRPVLEELASNTTAIMDYLSQNPTAHGRPVSGFLGDYSKLLPDPGNGDLLLYLRDANALKNYHKFIFDPVNIYLLPESRGHAIDADDLYRLAEFFRETVIDEFKGSKFEFVEDPGPGVLELNFAITDVSPTGGTRNAVVKGAATTASIMTVPGIGLAVPRLSVGRISIEGEMLDSVSGERIVAFLTSRRGRRWFSGLNTFRTWGDIQRAFRSWARNFRERMDAAHGVS